MLRSVILPKCLGHTIEHVLESHRVRPGAWCYPRHHPTPHTPPSSWRPCGTCSGHTAGCSWAGRRLRQRWNVATWILLIRNLITNYEKKNFRFYSIFHTLFAYASFLFPLNHFSFNYRRLIFNLKWISFLSLAETFCFQYFLTRSFRSLFIDYF